MRQKGKKPMSVKFLDAKISEHRPAGSYPGDKYINVKEAAALLRLSEISIRRLLWKKKLTRYKAGGRTLLRQSQVMGLIHEA